MHYEMYILYICVYIYIYIYMHTHINNTKLLAVLGLNLGLIHLLDRYSTT
jgi:hypothetical protein